VKCVLHRRRASCCRRDHGHRRRQVWVKDQVSTRSPIEVTVTTGRVQPDMTVFSKILKAGEGKRVRQLAELVPPINELADEMAALSEKSFEPRPTNSALASLRAKPGRHVARSLRRGARGRDPGARQRHYDVQLMAACPALWVDR